MTIWSSTISACHTDTAGKSSSSKKAPGQDHLQYPYLLHVIIGYIHWLYFSQTITKSISSLPQNAGLIKNHNFPLLALPLSKFLSRSLDYLVGLIILAVAFFALGQNISVFSLASFVLILGLQVMLQFGLALISSTLNIFVRDVQFLVGLLLQIWFYATPVIYSVEMLPEKIRVWLSLNPLTIIFTAYRQVLFNLALDTRPLLAVFLLSVITLSLGLILFNKYQHKAAELL